MPLMAGKVAQEIMLTSPKEKNGIPNAGADELRSFGSEQTQQLVDAYVSRDPSSIWGADSRHLTKEHAQAGG